ncbi:MAG: hypothetical protein IJB75_08100 [Oscillospiraceae bacterium]|nr:hypothetical protein [Oscillospiraceae bacterium]MBQ6706162.1 hypothetical protein [Clostridia bacterium]
MFAFKKKYRPIRGQTWWEKILDVVTREYPLNQIEMIVFSITLLGMIAFLVLLVGLKIEFSRPVKLMIVWGEVGLMFLSYILWGIEWLGGRTERSVKRRVSEKIEQYVTENVSCGYDELIRTVMNVRIHRGFDEALKELESERKLAVYDGICRLPTREDKDRWRAQEVKVSGVSFETLTQVFAHSLEALGGELRIEFSVWEDEAHRLEKVMDEQTNTDLYVCTVAGGERREFSSFAELSDAPLFDGQTLKEVCDRICVSCANDFSCPSEFFEAYGSHFAES